MQSNDAWSNTTNCSMLFTLGQIWSKCQQSLTESEQTASAFEQHPLYDKQHLATAVVTGNCALADGKVDPCPDKS